MNIYIFNCHRESRCNTWLNQTLEELGRYTTLTYKYEEDIYNIVRTLQYANIPLPNDVIENYGEVTKLDTKIKGELATSPPILYSAYCFGKVPLYIEHAKSIHYNMVSIHEGSL